MTAWSFVGYGLIGLGPVLAVFGTVVLPKSLLVLVSLASTFFWLTVLIVVALLWRPFLPAALSPAAATALVLSVVLVEEAARTKFLWVQRWLERALDGAAASYGLPRWSPLDRVYLATAGGVGHAAAHACFIFLSVTTPAVGAGTMYMDACPNVPFFLVIALLSAAFSVIHMAGAITSSCRLLPPLHPLPQVIDNPPVCGGDGGGAAPLTDTLTSLVTSPASASSLSSVPASRSLVVPVLHAVAALLTVTNFVANGCATSIPILWVCALLSCWLCQQEVYRSK